MLLRGRSFQILKPFFEVLAHVAVHVHENTHHFHDKQIWPGHAPSQFRRHVVWFQRELIDVPGGTRPDPVHLYN